MRKSVVTVCGLILFVGINGCDSENDSLIKVQIQFTNELADALEKGADPSNILEIQKRAAVNTKKIEALPEDERKRLTEKYKDDLEKATARMFKLMTKNAGNGVGNSRFPNVSSVTKPNRHKK
jgi:hypothetical protein